MGLARYTSRKTGEELEADFPLHPSLINATKADGSTVQFMRDKWDEEFSQQLPELPKVDPSTIPGAPPPYEPPKVTPVGGPLAITRPPGQREPLPDSHAAWYALIYDQLVTVDRKIDRLISDLSKPDVEELEVTPAAPPPPAEPPPQG